MDKLKLKGFGLVEMLLVMMIISILMVFSYYYVPQAKSLITVKEEINQLLVEAHQSSLLSQKRVYVEVIVDGIVVYLESGAKQYNGIHIQGESFSYTEKGTISKSQTWHVQYGEKRFDIVFYLGSGYVDFR